MKKLLLATIAAATVLVSAPAHADFAEDAQSWVQYRYEFLCEDKLVLTHAKLRAQLDRKYRDTPQLRSVSLSEFNHGS